VNVHFSTTKQAKDTEKFLRAVALGEKEPEIPSDVMIMVCGDFNGEPGKARYRRVFNSTEGFIDLEPTHLGWKQPVTSTLGGTEFNKKMKPIAIYHKLSETGEASQKRIDYMFWRSDTLLNKHAYILNPLIMDQESLINMACIRLTPL